MNDTQTAQGDGTAMQVRSHFDLALLQLAQRIEGVLKDEARLLALSPSADLEFAISRKNHLVLEASRLLQHTQASPPAPPIVERMRRVSAALAENLELLRRHVSALSEVSALVSEVALRASADGTYTANVFRQGAKQ